MVCFPAEFGTRLWGCHAVDFSVVSGEEYYLDARFGSWAGNWKLLLVNNLEGEDGVGAAEPVPNPQNGGESH